MKDKKELEQLINKAVEKAVRKTVNGKIDDLKTQLDDHTKTVQPYLQGLLGIRVIGRIIMWVGGLAAAYIAIRTFLE